MDKPFQRKGAESNSRVGRDFEARVQASFGQLGILLQPGVVVEIGLDQRKPHKFDLGGKSPPVLVECKAHKWTEGGNVPSAKMAKWNEAMLHFIVAPRGQRKILCVLKDFSQERNETLGQYYVRTNPHLIPADVEVWELDEASALLEQIK